MKKNLFFAILCVLGLFGTINAQNVVTIDGTVGGYTQTTINNVPVFAAQKCSVSQQYYTAAEIGKSSGTIESIAFKTADAGFPCERNLDVYMLNTTTENFGVGGKAMVQVSASDLVFSGNVNFSSAETWVSIDITDFEYTGANVLLCVNDKTVANHSGGADFHVYEVIYDSEEGKAYKALYKKNSTALDPTASAIAGCYQSKPVPFVQFTFAAGTTEEYADPSDPTNFVATAVKESKIQLTWDAAAETESYNIYEGTNLVANVEGTSYAVKNLALGQHCFTIKGANGPKESTGVEACATLVAKAVESITVGTTGEGDSQTAPISLYTQNSWVEQLYTATEIGQACKIERISFATKPANQYSEPFTTKEIKIYLAETIKFDYADNTLTPEADLKLVYSDTDIIIGDQEWETFEFDTPFNYGGVKNLAVVVVKSAEETSAQYFWHTNTVANSVLYAETATYPTQANLTDTRPVVRFAWETEEVEPTPTVPAAPVVEATANANAIVLTWAAVETATSYNVYQGTEKLANVTELTYTVEGLEFDTEYCFTVTAVNENGESQATEACATTAKAEEDEPIVPENPEVGYFPTTFFFGFEGGNLNGLNVTDANNDKITWEYRYGSDGGGFKDEGGVYSGSWGHNKANDYLVTASKYSMTTTSEFSFVFVPYDCSTYFHEKIAVVVSEDGEEFETVWSYEIEEIVSAWDTATVDLKAYAGKDLYVGLHHYGSEDGIRVDNIKLYSQEPAVPANLTATATETTITLTWDAVSNATSYNVYAVEGEDYKLLGNVAATTFTVEGLELETEYSYAVTAVNEFKESKYANVTVMTALPEGVELLLKETFESYEVGQYIAKDGGEHWTTWSKKEGGSEDGVIAESNGNKYGHLTYGNDQVLLLGGYKSGEFDLELDIYVPAGAAAYYNVLHEFNGNNSSWAMQSYLQMTDNGTGSPAMAEGHGSVHAGEANVADIPCIYDAWMHFRMHINANTDKAELYYTMPGAEEVKACEWQWSKDCFGESVVGRKLDAMNFYPSNNKSEYYIDNLSLKRYGGAASAIVTINKEEIEASMDVNDMSTVELEIENIGTSIAEYVAWVDYGQGAMSDRLEVVSYSLEDLSTSTPIGWSPDKPLTFEIASLYTSSSYGNSVMGTYVTAAAYFLGEFKDQSDNVVPMLEPGTNMVFRIYSQGINGVPGAVLAEKVLPADSIKLDWNYVFFDEPVLLTGFDFYAAVEMTQSVDGVPMVLDGNKDGELIGYGDLCRQSSTAAFRSITDFIDGGEKYGNFHLMVLCQGEAVKGGWVELSKKEGVLEIGAKETINVDFVSVGLEKGKTYNAKVVFNTNTEEGIIEIPVSLYVWGEDVEEILSNTYNIYPNPTTAQVTVEGENINYIAVYNSVGQLVKVVKTQNHVVDMSAYDNGVYFFNIVDNAGQSSVQRVVVAK